MKLYIVFTYDSFYPEGGWFDIMTGVTEDGEKFEAVTTNEEFALHVAKRRTLFGSDSTATIQQHAQVVELDTSTLKTRMIFDE